MKIINLVVLFFFGVLSLSYGQDTGVKIVQKDSTMLEEYCSVLARSRLLSEEVTIAIDFGDNPNNRKRLRDRKGDILKFSSVIDALNFLGEQGWKLVNAFPVNATANSAPQYTYIFKRDYLGKKPKD